MVGTERSIAPRETTTRTSSPTSTLVPAGGSTLETRPLATHSSCSSPMVGASLSVISSATTSAGIIPMRPSGTSRGRGPSETKRSTADPWGAVASEVSTSTTRPAATSSLHSLETLPTVRPASSSRRAASVSLVPTRSSGIGRRAGPRDTTRKTVSPASRRVPATGCMART